ncbi:MAG TPA: hypothetical protein VF310_01585 [Vicinamibacteria bacterium]
MVAVQGLAWLKPPLEVARLGVFAVFLALLAFAWWRRDRRSADRLIVYVLAMSLAVGLSQQESWPFSNWALVHGIAPARAGSWEIEAVDAAGRAWPVDPRVLQPLSPEEFGAWMLGNVPRLLPAERARLAAFLLDRAESGRRRLKAGETAGVSEARLGPLAAPYHFHTKAMWKTPADVPDSPFVAVRVWATSWDVEERARDERRVARRLLLASPAGPAA